MERLGHDAGQAARGGPRCREFSALWVRMGVIQTLFGTCSCVVPHLALTCGMSACGRRWSRSRRLTRPRHAGHAGARNVLTSVPTSPTMGGPTLDLPCRTCKWRCRTTFIRLLSPKAV
jgi:hypothetical protein